MIHLINITTLPENISNFIQKNRSFMKREYYEENRFYENNRYGFTTFPTPLSDNFSELVRDTIKNSKLICYHCTNLINQDLIFEQGLNVLKVRDFKNYIISSLSAHLPKDIINDLINQFNNYIDGCEWGKRENMIWFVANLTMANRRECRELLEYFGGEITRRLSFKHAKIVYPLLKNIGTPSIIECIINFDDVADYKKEHLITAIYENAVGYTDIIEWDCHIAKNLPSKKIIKIIKPSAQG